MDTMRYKNSQALLSGYLAEEPTYSHECKGESFYKARLDVLRKSGVIDTIPVIVSEVFLTSENQIPGTYWAVAGQIRSYNERDAEGKMHLQVFFFIMQQVDREERIPENEIFLDGYLCSPPNHRMTPTGREISDMMIAVNRSFGKTDYIPCICWGRNALFASRLAAGNHIQIHGRIQSREYIKQTNETESEQHIVYEVSASRVKLME